MRIGIINILGADQTIFHLLKEHFHNSTVAIGINEPFPDGLNLVLIPPSHLYCESEELKRRVATSKLFKNLAAYASTGGYIVGLQCGFDILCQARLLPGKFSQKNPPLVSQPAYLIAEIKRTPLTYLMNFDQPIKLFLSHSLGGYQLSPLEISTMRLKGQIILRYCNESGQVTRESNVDNSTESVAAVCNDSKNIYGMTANPTTGRYLQTKLDGIELMDNFFKMITR